MLVRKRLLLVATALVISGCAHQAPPLYSWGHYQPLLYDMYKHPGKAEPAEQVTTLTADIDKAVGEGKRVPPGVHAQLGYMYFDQGKDTAAAQQFATERQLYPESTVFMDRLLKRLGAAK